MYKKNYSGENLFMKFLKNDAEIHITITIRDALPNTYNFF
jgi:hypothetical protein